MLNITPPQILRMRKSTAVSLAAETGDCAQNQVMLGPLRRRTCVRTDAPQLILPQAAQLFLMDPPFSEKSPEDKVELRVSIVVLAIDLFTAFGQVMFQVPQICRLLDLTGFLLCFPNHLL